LSTAGRSPYATAPDSRRSVLDIAAPGEQFTIKVFEDFLRKVWTDKIQFLNIANPVQVPIGPATVTDDNITFSKTAQL
jgi:hypothetical protein